MKAYKDTKIKYYKYVETEGSLPTFASAQEAVNGVNGVTVSPTDIWSAVGTSKNTGVTNSTGRYYVFTFEKEFKITSFTYKGYMVSNSLPQASFIGLDAYDESTEEWVSLTTEAIGTVLKTISIDNDNFYYQYRIKLKGGETNIYAKMGVNTVKMDGIFKILQESDETDYEIAEEVDVYKLVKKTGVEKYYSIGG